MINETQFLEEVKQRIRHPNMWCKEHYDNEHGRVCLMGAIYSVNRKHQTEDNNYADSVPDYRARDLLKDCLPEPFSSIEGFNDAPKTKHKDVVAVIECAISKSMDPFNGSE